MPELGTYGSVRSVLSNGRLYRDSWRAGLVGVASGVEMATAKSGQSGGDTR